jgi:Dolichyl-phosphate-mannose-protein mannosyltransferase
MQAPEMVSADSGAASTDPLGKAEPFSKGVWIVGGVVFAVLMALSDRYGFHRDELYMLDSARHLSASYVDQGVFAPLMARVTLVLWGVSLPGLRLWSALAAFATVIVGGLTAREFGGTRRAQLLTAVAVGCMPVLLGADHLANTTSYMLLACAALALVAARIGRTGDPRWWLAGGAITGIGADDNHLVAIFAVVLTICALAIPGARGLVLNRWFAGGAVIALVIFSPDVWWQATHGWATFAMTHALNSENGGPANIVTWIIGQIGLPGVATIWIWPAGLRFLWRSSDRPLWRALALSYGILFIVYALTTGAQTYYVSGLYVALLAAGFVYWDGWLHARAARLRRFLIALAVTTALGSLVALPILPVSDIAWTYKDNPSLGETVGWPQLVQTVHGVWFSLPPAQRANAVIYASDYGEEGAINELGRGTGLPAAAGGQNTDWWWGPGNPHATTVVVIVPRGQGVAADEAQLREYFTGVRVAATLSNPDGIHNIEWGGHVYVCTGPRQPWGQLWNKLRNYD